MEAALNTIPDAVLVLDDAFVPTFASENIEPILGVGCDQLIGKPFDTWCRYKEILEYVRQLKSAMGMDTQVGHFSFSPPAQPGRRIAVSTYPLFSPHNMASVLGRVLVFRDVGEQLHATQAGAEFVNRVAHDLKTPLANLQGYSELLLDYETLDDLQRVRAVCVIHDEAERANALIQNVLIISRLDSGALMAGRNSVDVQQMLNEIIDTMSTRAQSRDISLELKLPASLLPARLDKDLLRIAIENLTVNAIMFCNPAGSVVLSAAEIGADQLEISVTDNGIGIPEADFARIFDRYSRGSDRAALDRDGHGLGLYVARQIMELHGGSISVASEMGKGSRFTVVVPANRTQPEGPRAA